MSSTDYLRLGDHKIFTELCESLPKNVTKTMNLLTVHDNILFTWDLQNHCILSLNLKAARGKEGDNVIHQKLLPIHPPLFTPEFLLVNDKCTLLVVAGPHGVLVLELPVRSPPYGAFDNNKEVVYCKTHSLDERLLACSETVEVRQAKFHPGSINHNYILVLTSDNMLRLYEIENNQAVNKLVYQVGEKPATLFPGSKTPFLDIYGEVAVDFDFGHPEIFQPPQILQSDDKSLVLLNNPWNKKDFYVNAQTQTVDKIVPKRKEKENVEKYWDNLIWPIYLLRSDMSVYIVDIDLKKRLKPALKGPLPMASFDEDQVEACSLVCLNTVPQIISIALSNGTLYHSILLDTEPNSLVEVKENRINIFLHELPTKELLAFENVELELGLITCEEDLDNKYKCPIFLKKDDSNPGRYYATHSAGVHSITITCVDDLQQFVNSSDDAEPTSDIFVNPSKAEYLVCTKVAASEKSNRVVGFSLYYEPPSVITLLSDGRLVTLGVMSTGTLPKIEDLMINEDTGNGSPLKKMLQEPFDQYIEKILKKTPTQPVLKLPSTGESNQEYYELLQRAAQVFRDNYFKNHMKAKEELDKRVQTLNMMKKNQQREIEFMVKERDLLQEKASNLAEKYEDIKDKQDDLLKKAENLLMLISRKRSIPSEAEQAFMKELNESSLIIGTFGNKIEKIKSKMKYQQIQMENWKSQETKKLGCINEKHTQTIKTNLQDSYKKIAEMIKQVNEFKKQLDLK